MNSLPITLKLPCLRRVMFRNVVFTPMDETMICFMSLADQRYRVEKSVMLHEVSTEFFSEGIQTGFSVGGADGYPQ